MTGQELLDWLRECSPDQLRLKVLLSFAHILETEPLITAKVYTDAIYLVHK